MALAAFQHALARLYVDARARDAFAADPAAYVRASGLDALDAGRLHALGSAHVAAYARTLERKRRNEIARLAPHLASALGPAFADAVHRYASRTSASGADRRPVRDARAFARFVRSEPAVTPEVRDAARNEERVLTRRAG